MSEKGQLYGNDMTIHQTGHLNIEVNEQGEVIAVWFRCMMLPFQVHKVSDSRAKDLRAIPMEIDLTAIQYQKRGQG